MDLPREILANILFKNAQVFFSIPDSVMGETGTKGH
jgi:hypothetical protein